MYNLNTKLNSFYHDKVRLTQSDRDKLREYKRLNIDRLKSGIDSINQEQNKSIPYPEIIEQGSIPMHTANQYDDNDYDIDIAVIFHKDDISSSPLEARKLVEKALKKKTGNFSREPEARTNAVTVWYAEGYHIDFAIHREYEDFWGLKKSEHAGSEWSERNPRDIKAWFLNCVANLSPSTGYGVNVESGQFRKVVRLIKKFTKSRDNWSLPGGLIISALAEECYRSDNNRDDIALVNTIKALNARLKWNKQVLNPVNNSLELTYKNKFKYEVNRLSAKLNQAEKKLEVLFKQDCSEKDANKAWKWFFNSDFWVADEEKLHVNEQRQFSLANHLELSASLHKSKQGFRLNSNIPNGKMKLPKKMWIKFIAVTSIQPPFDVKWIVENEGDEAEQSEDLGHENIDSNVYNNSIIHWERTAYKGKHRMICQILKNNSIITEKKFEVLIQK